MVHKRRTGIRSTGRVLDRLLIDGKRTVVACALVLVMVGMWVRVLIGRNSGPAAAAGSEQRRTQPARPARAPRIAPVELPRLPGRHDTIRRDFFGLQNSTCFRSLGVVPDTGTNHDVRVASPDDVHDVIHRVAQTLRLEAVYWRQNEKPTAFINNRLLGRGDVLSVKSDAGSFVFDVLEISENSVLVECRDVQVTLRLLTMEVLK